MTTPGLVREFIAESTVRAPMDIPADKRSLVATSRHDRVARTWRPDARVPGRFARGRRVLGPLLRELEARADLPSAGRGEFRVLPQRPERFEQKPHECEVPRLIVRQQLKCVA